MKAVVVGAGLTGCVAALKLRDAGAEVGLYDFHPYLGGVLKDAEFDGDVFLNSCQYLNEGAPWLESLRTRLDLDLVTFQHTYANVTELDGGRASHDDFAGPTFRGVTGMTAVEGHAQSADSNSVADRLARYPGGSGDALTAWFRGFRQDIDALHHLCTVAAQCSRVYFEGAEAEVAEHKRTSPGADELLGLPRSTLSPDRAPLRALLPADGYDRFFDRLGEFLTGQGIDIHLGAPVRPRNDPERGIRLNCRDTEIDADVVVWACNPVPLLICLGLGRLDNPAFPMQVRVYDARFENGPVAPFYVQCFSERSPITRIFAYEVGGRQCVTVEAFADERTDEAALSRQAGEFLSAVGRPASLTHRGELQQRRHVFFTVEDFERFRGFGDITWSDRPGPTVVGGAWQVYGRDQKIELIDRGIEAFFSRRRGG